MKIYLFRFIAAIIVFLSTNNTLLCQENFVCGFEDQQSLKKSVGLAAISSIPTSGTLKVLVIMCKFKDDTFDLSPHTDPWPSSHVGMPSFANSLLSPTVQESYPDPSLSGYFHDMSHGALDIIGDEVFYEPLLNQSDYFPSSGRDIGDLSEEIIRGVDGLVDFSDYDNDGDGVVDMIMICFRFANTLALDPNFPEKYNGVASLTGFTNFGSGSSITLDGTIIEAGTFGSGTFSEACASIHDALSVNIHEFGHYLFGAGHYEGVGFHGVMDGSGTGIMHTYEKEILGWITPTVVSSDTSNVSITDAISNNSAYKIFTGSGGEYFLIENHQRLNFYENSFLKHNGGALRSPGTGLLITHIRPGVSKAQQLDIESAFGRWNWQKSGTRYVFPFAVNTENPTGGEDKLDLRRKSTTSGTQTHPDFLGSQDDFFNKGGKEMFYPWSNPNTSPDASSIAVEIVDKTGNNIIVNFHVGNAPPAKPTNLQVASVNNRPRLTWDANSEPDIAGYYVFRSENGGAMQYIASTIRNDYTDSDVSTNLPYDNYDYKIKARDTAGKTSLYSDAVSIKGIMPKINNQNEVPEVLSLEKNYPNPFNPSTKINFSIPKAQSVKLSVFNVLGQKIIELVNNNLEAGSYSVTWNGDSQFGQKVNSGIYFAILEAEDRQLAQKMILSK